MTATAPTSELLAQIVDQMLLVENLRDPRQPHGTPTTAGMAAFALREEGVAPTPALVEVVLALVASKRSRVDAA